MPAASDKEREIHSLIVSKDDLAFARLCDEYYEAVFNKVMHLNRALVAGDEALVMDVVTDSFMKYFRDPERYDPDKMGLEGFLLMDISGDLKNALQKLKRLSKKTGKAVELFDRNGNELLEDPEQNVVALMIEKEDRLVLEQALTSLFDNETDLMVANLLLSGERRSDEYARLLNITHLDDELQQLEIKRCKDRVDKMIKRKLRAGRNNE